MKAIKHIVYILFLGILLNNFSIQAGQLFSRRRKPKKLSDYPKLCGQTTILAKTIMKFYEKVRDNSGDFSKEIEVLKLKANEFDSDWPPIDLDYQDYAKQLYVNESGLPEVLPLSFSEELERLVKDFRSILEQKHKPFYPVFSKYYSDEMPVSFLFFWANVKKIVNLIIEQNNLKNFIGDGVAEIRRDVALVHVAHKFAEALLALDREN